MRRINMLALAAVAALGVAVASPAAAATIDLSQAVASASNVQGSSVTQATTAVNASIGTVTSSTIDVAATAANNIASNTVDIDQTNYVPLDLLQVSNVAVGAVNSSLAPVLQSSTAGNLTGAVGASAIDVAASAVSNAAVNVVTGVQ